MLRHRNIDRICCWVLAAVLLITCGVMGAWASGLAPARRQMGYENRLFDTGRVHTLNIVMEDWEGFLSTCTDEEYAACHVVIDGESYRNVAIRAKGNTSLSSVKQYGNNRYSFKIEFDHYQPGSTLHGLDKLSLNNLIQDPTCMKDYLAYTLMRLGGAAAPLCSFVQITVNGEPWGLYLAVEGVEDSFLSRNFGSGAGELYKPDSMSFGGGRGNGKGFDMEDFHKQLQQEAGGNSAGTAAPAMPEGMPPSGGMIPPGGFSRPTGNAAPDGNAPGSALPSAAGTGFPGSERGGMGSSDVLLQYTDDDPASYANIFENAKTDVTEADQQRLIRSLKALAEGDASVVDQEAVIRYLAVHNFLCNDDSYTGTMVHNYYLYEKDGVLSMLPWDYNLAFGGFGMGGRSLGATEMVNRPIDTPVTGGDISTRPILSWIFENEDAINSYHEAYGQFVNAAFASGWFAEEMERVSAMIASFVQQDPTAFYTYEEFEAGVAALRDFCLLRAQSVQGQLDGSIPSTSEGQRSSDALVDASHLTLSDMGGMGETHGGMGAAPAGGFGGRGGWMNGSFAGDRSGADARQAGVPFEGEAPAAARPKQETPVPTAPSGQAWGMVAFCAVLLLAALVLVRRYRSKL